MNSPEKPLDFLSKKGYTCCFYVIAIFNGTSLLQFNYPCSKTFSWPLEIVCVIFIVVENFKTFRKLKFQHLLFLVSSPFIVLCLLC